MNFNPNNGANLKASPTGSTENEIKKYLRIARKRKWLIFVTFLFGLMAWIAFVLVSQGGPLYESTVLLSFQDPRTMSAVEQGGRRNLNVGKASLMKTNVLLGEVVEKLQLNLSVRTENISKSQLFDFVEVNRNAIPGDYKIVKQPDGFNLFYSNDKLGIKNKLLGRFSATDTVELNQMRFVINPTALGREEWKEIEFRVSEFQNAIEKLRNSINSKMDRSQTILTVSVSHKNPVKAAKIVNTLADLFVELNLKMKRYKSDEVIRILENQLALAKRDLDEANSSLRKFREKYPWVVLTADAGIQVGAISRLEEEKNNLSLKAHDIQNLLVKIDKSPQMDEKISNARELLTYLSTEQLPIATAFLAEFNDLFLKRNNLLSTYAPTHPFVEQNNQAFSSFFNKLKSAANDYLTKILTQSKQVEAKIEVEQRKLRGLPKLELELAELIRDRDLKDDLYKRILARFNAAKIENEVEVSDVYIVDYGTPSTPIGRFAMIFKKSLFGIVIALGLGIGLAIVVEFFDKTVQNVDELQERTAFPVLGYIPVIYNEDEVPENFEELKGKRDPKLVTIDYSPTHESESYRDLRTKILYLKQKENLTSFIITSLQPNEGKSLTAANLAITFAQQKLLTLLIDGDMRRGVLHNEFGNKKKPGLSDLLVSGATIDYENLSKIIQNTFIPNLYLISSGSLIPNPSEILGTERMVQLLELIRSKFGMVIIDTAPFQSCSDAAVMSMHVDGVLVVTRAGYTNVEQLNQKISEYPHFQKKILGMILNMVKLDLKKNQYQYSYYNY